MGHGRKHSSSSSSSSSSSDSDSSKKKKQKKASKLHTSKHEQKHQYQPNLTHHAPSPFPHAPQGHDQRTFQPSPMSSQQPHIPSFGFPNAPVQQPFNPAAPAPSQAPPPPAAGHRIALSTETPFPAPASLPATPFHDLGGPQQPVYVGSAIFPSGVHPCKIAPHLNPPARVPYGGGEHEHRGRYDLLPIDDQTMEWVVTGHGMIPPGRRPIEGGYEENGARLFHAIAYINGIWIPGKTGEHLRAANIPFAGEQSVTENYKILCWRY